MPRDRLDRAPMPTISAMRWTSLCVLNPQAGEEEALASRRQLMMNAEKIAGRADRCARRAARRGDERARLPRRSAGSSARRGRRPAARPVGRGARARARRDECRAPRSRRRSPLPPSSQAELERAEERLFALRALARKHKVGSGRSAGLGRPARGGKLAALDHGREAR